jgi:hypothetical protein
MPSSSQLQHNLMLAVTYSDALSKKTGIPKDVADEFIKADADVDMWQVDDVEGTVNNVLEYKGMKPIKIAALESICDDSSIRYLGWR